jgi:hypothetical protein
MPAMLPTLTPTARTALSAQHPEVSQ